MKIFKAFKYMSNLIKSSFISIAKGIVFVSKKIFGFLYSILNIIKYFFIYIYKGIYFIFKSIFMIIKFILTYISKFLIFYIANIIIGLKAVVVLIIKSIFYILKSIYKIIKFIIKYIGIVFVFIGKKIYIYLKYVVLGLKFIMIGIYKILKYIIKYIKIIFIFLMKKIYTYFRYVFLGLKFILISLYKCLINYFIYIYKGLICMFLSIFKFIKQTVIYFIYGLEGIYLFFIFLIKYMNKKLIGVRKFLYKIFISDIANYIKKTKEKRKIAIEARRIKKIELDKKKKERNAAIFEAKRIKKAELDKKKNEIKAALYEVKKIKKDELDKKKKEKYASIYEAKRIKKIELDKKKNRMLIEKIAKDEKIRKEKAESRSGRKENEQKIKDANEENRQKKRQSRVPIVQQITNWYNSLSFVKDIKNKREMNRQTLLIDFEGEDAIRSDEKIMYKYVARNAETGKVEKGMFAAFSKLDVHSYLLAEKYEVYEITPQRKFTGNIVSTKIKKSDLVFFLTQLSTFLRSGITLVEAVKILEKQTKRSSYKQVYKAILYELTMGENFSEALAKQGESYPRLLVNMIKTSELTGNLPETLDDMASYYSETEKTRKQMVSAMTYPIVIFVFATVIITFILIYVIPEFVSIYADMETELPSITQMVINTSKFLQKNVIYLVVSFISIIVIFRILFKTIKVFKTFVQWILMHIPIMGKIIIYNEVTMFTKTFGSLLNHNVFITDSMEVLSKITDNEIYKMLIFDTITNLAKGEPISNSFKNHWAFPIVAYEMLLTGEKTGQLGDMMDKVSVYYQEQHRNSVNQIKTFIEPVMIVFLAVVVGGILLSVILPMFSMYSTVS